MPPRARSFAHVSQIRQKVAMLATGERDRDPAAPTISAGRPRSARCRGSRGATARASMGATSDLGMLRPAAPATPPRGCGRAGDTARPRHIISSRVARPRSAQPGSMTPACSPNRPATGTPVTPNFEQLSDLSALYLFARANEGRKRHNPRLPTPGPGPPHGQRFRDIPSETDRLRRKPCHPTGEGDAPQSSKSPARTAPSTSEKMRL